MTERKRIKSIKGQINIKIIIVGDTATGKTSIINRYIDNNFSENTRSTIVSEFSTKVLQINGIQYNINFWDIPGQDRNPVATRGFVVDCNGIIYCCDVSNIKTRENIKKWEENIKSLEDIDNVPKILIENKCDKLGDESHYNDNNNSLRKFSNERDCLNFFRTSALNGYNVKEALDYLINQIINRIKEEDIEYYNNRKTINSSTFSKKKYDKCC